MLGKKPQACLRRQICFLRLEEIKRYRQGAFKELRFKRNCKTCFLCSMIANASVAYPCFWELVKLYF